MDEPAMSPEEQGERVVEVRVEGNRRVEAEAIRRALRDQAGRASSIPPRTAEDLRAVWRLGYFTDVQLLVQRLPAASPTWCGCRSGPRCAR